MHQTYVILVGHSGHPHRHLSIGSFGGSTMDRHRSDKRRKQHRGILGSVWAPTFAAILFLYVVFMVKVNYYAVSTTTAANGIGTEFGGGVKGGREMTEEKPVENAPEPALAQAAKPVVAPLRPEMKRPTREPAIQVGAITKQPAPVPAQLVQATTQPKTAPPAVVAPESTPPPPMRKREGAAAAPVVVSNDTPAPVAAPVVATKETAAPVAAPVVATKETDAPVAAPAAQSDMTPAPVEAPVVESKLTPEPVAAPAAAVDPPPAPTQTKDVAVYDEKAALADRHKTLHGYRQTNNFLGNYKAEPGESLFLFFTCSDEDFNAHDWSSECAEASKLIYDVFAKSPKTNRLVTIYAGTENFWNYQNKFRNDRDLRIKAVPCLMKWHGNGGETSGMMITDTLFEEPFLRYLFKNTDKPDTFLNAAAMVETKSIQTVDSHDALQVKLNEYKLEPKPRRPLYLMFVSGRLSENNRPWCPYCRFSELPLEYGFYAFAPPNSRLLRIEVSQTYQQWKTPNKFNQDQSLGPLRGVPAFFTVQQLASQELKLDRIFERFDRIATLKNLFATAARVHDE